MGFCFAFSNKAVQSFYRSVFIFISLLFAFFSAIWQEQLLLKKEIVRCWELGHDMKLRFCSELNRGPCGQMGSALGHEKQTQRNPPHAVLKGCDFNISGAGYLKWKNKLSRPHYGTNTTQKEMLSKIKTSKHDQYWRYTLHKDSKIIHTRLINLKWTCCVLTVE